MFTGIVEEVGWVQSVTDRDGVRRVRVRASFAGELALGGSVAVNGACLSVVERDDVAFEVEAIPETMHRTTPFSVGAYVNLERPLLASGRFDGHIVQGHVDGVAFARSIEEDGGSKRIWFVLPVALRRYVVEKGSIAVAGVSLTVSGVDSEGFEVSLIPVTLADTTLGALNLLDEVNIEVDLVAKYIERLMPPNGRP